MNGESLWKKITTCLSNDLIEIATIPSNNREPLWFSVYLEDNKVYVYNAKEHKPSTKMTRPRQINKRDFLTVYPYYYRWKNGERYLRQEVRLLSRNTAYIFALISYFE